MSYTSTMSVGSDSPSSSQYLLSSSHSSLNTTKRTSSEISKTYKHASQLYLTRRLTEAYESLQPVITPPHKENRDIPSEDEQPSWAPIALASTSQRIKIWSLYITLLNAIVDLGSEQGKYDFGSKEYGVIARKVQSGDVWNQVVNDGYQGREGSVDAEVVYNLSNLLLGQAPNQSVNQSRLETYLSSSSNPNLDISAHLNNSLNGRRSYMNGASTPKDLSSRIKIIELFVLHVLPRNNEWDYARTFVTGSDILDEERREAFLQTLEELQVANEQETGYTSLEGDYGQEPEMLEPTPIEEPYSEQETQVAVKGINGISSQAGGHISAQHRRTSSEIDYGIEDRSRAPDQKVISPSITQPAVNQTEPTPTTVSKAQPTNPSRRQQPPSQKPNRKPSKSASSNTLLQQARHVLLVIRTITSNISSTLTSNPTALFRTVMFIFAFLILMSRKELRERIRRIMGNGWAKVKGTVGMGVKVSYI